MQVDHLVDQGEDLSAILCGIDVSDFASSQFEGLRMDSSEIIDDDSQLTPSSSLEDPLQYQASSCSNIETMGKSAMSQEPENLKKKKKKNGFLPGIVLSLSSRRKGAPHRAPLS